jgi:hypothetical protein
MRVLLQFCVAALLVGLTSLSPSVAQVVTQPVQKTAPPTEPRPLKQVVPAQKDIPDKSAPSAKQPASPIQAKSTILTTEQENKLLKEQVTQKDLIILNLSDRLKKAETAGELLSVRVKQLSDQIAAMTKPGGSQVRAYCASEGESRNTAGAVTNCASLGYACEAVSGLCYSRCSRTDQCARGWVCDSPNCIRVR